MIASTDSHGQLALFGFGDNDSYRNTPIQQFFHTDYMRLTRERNTIIDERTKLPPHFMPYPFLTNVNGLPHSLDIQKKLTGHSNLTQEEFEKYLTEIDGQLKINDRLEEVVFQSSNLTLRDIISPLNESQLK